MRYKFTHWIAEVFADLSHGDVVVHRKEPVEDPLGSTIVLHPGDELTVKTPLEHAHLEPVKSKPKE